MRVLGALFVISCCLSAQTSFPSDANVTNIIAFGADPTGVSDSTSAIQNAVYATSNNGNQHGQIVYLPAGTYKVSNTIWGRDAGGTSKGWLRFQGAGVGVTTLQLTNSTFTSKTNCSIGPYVGSPFAPLPPGCKAVIYLETQINAGFASPRGAGLDAYMNSVQDMTINTGTGNPGAIGIDAIISNSGAIRNVAITSNDGQGQFGLALTRDCCGGPGVVENITINGFDYCIAAGDSGHDEMGNPLGNPDPGYTLEHIHCNNQNVDGLYNLNFQVWIYDFNSVNAVPCVDTEGYGRTTIVTGSCTGGSGSNSAIVDNQPGNGGVTFYRAITTSGYARAIIVNGSTVAGTSITERPSKAVTTQFSPAVGVSIYLPIQNTPSYSNSNFATDWANVQTSGALGNGSHDDTAAIQTAMNSGKPVVYFPWTTGCYVINGTVTIPASVTLVEGVGSTLCTTVAVGARTGVVFNITATSGGMKIIKDFHFDSSTTTNGNFTNVTDNSTQTVVLQDNFDIVGYTGNTSNTLFYDDTACLAVFKFGGTMFARNLNTEINGPHVIINNTTAWVLGWKTEGGAGASDQMQIVNNSTAEIIGSFSQSNCSGSCGTYVLGQNSNFSLINLSNFDVFTPSVTEIRAAVTHSTTDTSWIGGLGYAIYSGSTFTNQTGGGPSYCAATTIHAPLATIACNIANGSGAVTSISAVFSQTPAAGHMLYVMGGYFDSGTSHTMTIADGVNTWTSTPQITASGLSIQVWYTCNSVAAPATPTVTFVGGSGATFPIIQVGELAGITTSSCLDTSVQGQNTTATASAGSITTASNNELILGFLNSFNDATAAGTGFTFMVHNVGGNVNASEYQFASTSGTSVTATFPLGGAGQNTMSALAFKMASAGSSTTSNQSVIVIQ